MGKATGIRTLTFVLPLFCLLVKDSTTRELARVRSRSGNLTDIASFPVLAKDRLQEVRLYDRMKCFPKVLCTLTKSGAFTKLGRVSLNDLADGYLRLLTAFPGGPPMELVEDVPEKFKHDFGSQPDSYPEVHHSRDDDSKEDDEDDDDDKIKDDKDSKELLLSDPLLHHKEKLEMQKLMEELMAEEKAEANKRKPSSSSWTSSAMSLPLKLGSSLLKDVVLPYFVGDFGVKRRGDLDLDSQISKQKSKGRQGRRVKRIDRNQDPFVTAMARWSRLKNPQQCSKLFTTCPFEAWEVVSMIKLIRKS